MTLINSSQTAKGTAAVAQRELDNMRSNAEPLESTGEAAAKIMKRPRRDCRSNLFLRPTMVAKRTIRPFSTNLPAVLGNVSSTRRIIGVIGIVCGIPFFVRSPLNSIESAGKFGHFVPADAG